MSRHPPSSIQKKVSYNTTTTIYWQVDTLLYCYYKLKRWWYISLCSILSSKTGFSIPLINLLPQKSQFKQNLEYLSILYPHRLSTMPVSPVGSTILGIFYFLQHTSSLRLFWFCCMLRTNIQLMLLRQRGIEIDATSLDFLSFRSHIVWSKRSLLSTIQLYWFPFFYHRRWMPHFLSRPSWSGYPDFQPDPSTSRWVHYSLLGFLASFSISLPCLFKVFNSSWVFTICQWGGGRKKLVKYRFLLIQFLPIFQMQHSFHYFHCHMPRLFQDSVSMWSIFVSFSNV